MALLLICLTALVVTLLIGVPIPFAFFAGTLTIIAVGGYSDFTFLLPYAYKQSSSIILMAIPLFIFAGSLMEKGGIGEALINLVEMFIGKIKGGLGPVMVVACGIFGAISGSGMATLSCIGSILLPRMFAAGYPRGWSCALISSASLLGLLIPPSLNMILYAFVGGQSVLACFFATVIPGIILIILFSVVFLVFVHKDPNIQVVTSYEGSYLAQLGKRTGRAIPALVAPLIILGGIYSGIMTPTEAAAVSVIYSIPVGFFIYKGLNLKTFRASLVESGTTAGVIMLMIFSVSMLARLYVMEDVPNTILNALLSISENPKVLIIFINVFLIIVGMIMDDTSAILLTTPILLPVATALGIDPIHYAAIIGVNLGLGCVTPPCAPFLYLGSRVGGTPVSEMLKPTMWIILLCWLPALIVTTYIPELSLFLPRTMGLI